MGKLSRLTAATPRSLREFKQSASHLAELRNLGWHRSVREQRPVDLSGLPVPWMCYQAAEILNAFIDPETKVLEWGSGASTAWLLERTSTVTSIEHDPEWYERVTAFVPKGADRVLVNYSGSESTCAFDEPYIQVALDRGSVSKFDVVIVDGMARESCLQVAQSVLSRSGVIVLDDSHRDEARGWRAAMRASGLREIRVSGVKPCAGQTCSTSFFLRREPS